MTWTVNFSIEDAKLKKSVFEINFDASRTLAQIEGWISGISFPLSVIIRGTCTAINISRSSAIPGILATPAFADADVEEKLRATLRTDGGFPAKISFPTVADSVILDGSSQADPANANIILLTNAIESGINVAGVSVNPTDTRGDDIASVVSLNEKFTASKG